MDEQEIIDLEMYELDAAEFQPLIRTRSNTWPMPRPDGYLDSPVMEISTTSASRESLNPEHSNQENSSQASGRLRANRKRPSRCNAWGSESYADLITQAISGSKEQRLTLSQIYDWMVENVSYFKEKAASNSSAGWKNSIRHNLSLHNRFIRVPNECVGKSSWWMINPDSTKLGKTSRRRAATMEAGKFERMRGRARRLQLEATTKRTKPVVTTANEGIEVLSSIQTQAFRPRASSCSSTLGRLSPIFDEPVWQQELFRYNQEQQLASRLSEMVTLTSSDYANQAATSAEQRTAQDSSTAQYKFNYQVIIPSDLKIVSTFSMAQATQCSLHATNTCNSEPTFSNAQQQYDQNGSCPGTEVNQFDQFYDEPYVDQQNAMVFRPALLSIQEMSENISVDVKVADEMVNQSAGSSTLVRDNSMLADIDEIISREQMIDVVNSNVYYCNNMGV